MASYCQYAHGRLCDSSKYHAKCKGPVRALFEPKLSKNRLCDSSEFHAGCMGSIGASFEPKISIIGPEMAKLWPSYQWEVA